jgi:hypothetical protein
MSQEIIPRESIKKPSAMIQTNVKGLTLTQRKLVNVLIKIAQESGNQEEYTIPLTTTKELCGITMVGNNDLKQQLLELQNIKIIFNYLGKDNEVWESNVFLPRVRIETQTGVMKFEFTSFIKHQILNPSMYAPLNVYLIAGFKSAYTVVLYEFLRDYLTSPKIPRLSIQEFRDFMGVEEDNYQQFKYLKRDVIDKAVTEINEKTDIYCKYFLEKRGRKYTHIQFAAKKNQVIKSQIGIEVPPAVVSTIPQERRIDAILDILRPYCKPPVDQDFLISNIKYSMRHAKNNFSHYLKKSLNEDYAREEREEFQRKEELTHQREMAKLKKQREMEKQEQLGESLFKALSLEDHLKYTEDVRVELKSLGISNQFITEDLLKMKIIEIILNKKNSEKHGIQADLF